MKDGFRFVPVLVIIVIGDTGVHEECEGVYVDEEEHDDDGDDGTEGGRGHPGWPSLGKRCFIRIFKPVVAGQGDPPVARF